MKRLLPILALCFFGSIAILPLFASGYFPIHDDTQIERVIQMGKALSEGQFPVRWVADLGYGYGYPIFNFYGPLPYYLGGILYAFGVPAIIATKLMFAVGITGPLFVTYAVLVSLVGWQAAFLASILYLFAPYHAVEIYVRGAVGEYWVLMFWPLILVSFLGLSCSKNRYRDLIMGVIGISGAVLSHTLMGYVTVLLTLAGLAGYWLFRFVAGRMNLSVLLWQGAVCILGLGISAFFWLPALWEMRYTNVAGQVSTTAHYADHFVCVLQLWASLWGFGGSAPGCTDGMSMMLGKIHLLLAGVSGLGWLVIRPKKKIAIFLSGAILAGVGIFFATQVSRFAWEGIVGFAYLQYPWRFLAVAEFGLSLLGGASLLLVAEKQGRTVVAVILALLVIYFNAKWFVPQYTYMKSSEDFETSEDLTWRASAISDEYLPVDVPRPKESSEVVSATIQAPGGARVTLLQETATKLRFVVEATRAGDIVINKAFFPGWRYFVNDKEVDPIVSGGLPGISLKMGQSIVEAQFTDTPVRTIANLISLMSLAICGVGIYEKQRKAVR